MTFRGPVAIESAVHRSVRVGRFYALDDASTRKGFAVALAHALAAPLWR